MKTLAKTRFTKAANKFGIKNAKPGDLLAYMNKEKSEGSHSKMSAKEKKHEKSESKAHEKAEHKKMPAKIKGSMKMAI